MINKSTLILFSLTPLFLSACGGGGSSVQSINEPNSTTTTAVERIQPNQPTADNWQSAKLINSDNPLENRVEIIGSELVINITSADISQGAHLQIYLNTDNKPETGFQFENEAWSESGVDYLIEDGDLFKSTANNTGWNWNVNGGAIDYSINIDNVIAKIDLSLLGDICNNLNIGVMTRDEHWDISTFSPASSQMQSFAVTYCNTEVLDTVKPVMTLIGANPIQLNINQVFTDPDATAIDNIDGDISDRITSSSTVNIAQAGTYQITYSVSDIAGNTSSLARSVIVNEIAPPEGIVIDGNINDWADVATFSSSADAIMKVSDDEEKLYILVTSSNLGENIQILMDTDNNATTGLELSKQVNAWIGGADYMIENNSLDKSKSNTGWSWDYGIAPIEYIKTADALEIAIKKSDLNSLANNIPMGYVSRTAEWNANYVLPEQALPSYVLQFPTTVNPVSANNDSVTTLNNQPIAISVLDNDFSILTGELTITSIEQPNSGTATIVGDQIVYTPNLTFTGTVNFTYEISDTNGNKDTATIKVIVTVPAPVAVNDSTTTQQDTPVTLTVLANDTTNSGSGQLTISNIGTPSNGIAQFVNGEIVYTPNSFFIGIDSFNYTIMDSNGETATATVTITVTVAPNNAPIANNDSATTDGIKTKQIQVLTNDTDEDGDSLQIIGFTQPSNGSLSLSTASATFNYTPNATASGTDTFTYTISDGNEGVDTATVTVTVPPNNTPDAVEDAESVDFDKTITIDVLSNDTDPDNDVLSVLSIVQPTVGIATLNANGSIFFDPQSNVGSISIGYTVTDSRGGTDFAILTVASTDPNDGNFGYPVIVDENVTAVSGTAVFVDVLANDSDPDGDALILDQLSGADNGTAIKINGGVQYTPNPGFVGTDFVYYGVHDGFGHNGFGTITITVIPEALQ